MRFFYLAEEHRSGIRSPAGWELYGRQKPKGREEEFPRKRVTEKKLKLFAIFRTPSYTGIFYNIEVEICEITKNILRIDSRL